MTPVLEVYLNVLLLLDRGCNGCVNCGVGDGGGGINCGIGGCGGGVNCGVGVGGGVNCSGCVHFGG